MNRFQPEDSTWTKGETVSTSSRSSAGEEDFISVPDSWSWVSSFMVKRDRVAAVCSTSVHAGGGRVRSEWWGRECEEQRWVKDVEEVLLLFGSSERRRSGVGSDPDGEETASGKPSEESGGLCCGRWKVREGSMVSLWVTSASRGWKESEKGSMDLSLQEA